MTTTPFPEPVNKTAAAAVGNAGRVGRPGSAGYYPLLAIAYAVTGRLGLLLAVPPGYASAIFPPAGIAAAAMLTAGPRSLPSIFIGSLLLNFWIGAGTEPLATAWFAAVLIAAASTAQGALLGSALRRTIGYPAPLDDTRQVASFLLLAPLGCLTSATLSLGGLRALGVVTGGQLATSWLAWWVGDTLGVLVVLPLMLVLFGEPRPLWRARLRSVALPMLLFFGLFVAIFIRVSAWEADAQLAEFRLVSLQALDKISTRLDGLEVFLIQLERSFGRAAPITRVDFANLVERGLNRFPMVQAVEWAPRVGQDERAAFEAAQRAERPQFEIRETGPEGTPHTAGRRPEFYPIAYVEPQRGNEAVVGMDLAAAADRYGALAEALATGKLIATRPPRLAGEPDRQQGVLLLMAVRQGGSGPGFLVVVLRVDAFIDDLLSGMKATLHLRMIDTARQQVLYDDFASAAPRAYRQEFDFGQRHFTIETEPSAAYLARAQAWQSWALLSAGVLGTALLGALLLLGSGYAHRIQAQVAEQTADLAAANRQLRVEIEERHHAEAALRQAQRMEAIGRLTGGIAHDFNNLLTVVSANAELLSRVAVGQTAQRQTAAILRAAERGGRLTRQLLSFSPRQTLRPEVVDLRTRTGEIADMLAHALPANIRMSLDLPEGLWPVAIDPAEFDLALLNIAVNARDAMPGGGQFIVAARNLPIPPDDRTAEGPAGSFVALMLSDTGCGMSAEILAHAFDPYFTTKDVGAGSGLGLSQVYGFAKQSGGAASLASEPGIGTTVTLLLPRAADAAGGDAPA